MTSITSNFSFTALQQFDLFAHDLSLTTHI